MRRTQSLLRAHRHTIKLAGAGCSSGGELLRGYAGVAYIPFAGLLPGRRNDWLVIITNHLGVRARQMPGPQLAAAVAQAMGQNFQVQLRSIFEVLRRAY
jgi:hypothetical protein